jgi:hypothetical protein
MRRIINITGLSFVFLACGYLVLFKREAMADMADSARGYPKARSPQECVELFRKAVAARRYDKAAKYCTKDFAEQLTRSADAADVLGEALDDLTARMEQDGISTGDLNLVLFYHDPLPPRLTMAVKTAGTSEATAILGVSDPRLLSYYPSSWPIDVRFTKGLYAYVPGTVRLVLDGEQWKIDVPVSPEQRIQVDALISNHMDYVVVFKKMSEDLQAGRTPKDRAELRFKELLAEAIRAKK